MMLVSGVTAPYTHGHLQPSDCHPFVRWMKRTRSISLVSYGESSTSEGEGEEGGSETTLPKKRPKSSTSSPPPPPPSAAAAATDTKQRKRQLPALAAHLASP